jgi:hypothetical protein
MLEVDVRMSLIIKDANRIRDWKNLFVKRCICHSHVELGSSHDQGTVQDCPKRPGRISANFARPSYHILLEFMIPMTWSRFRFLRRVE